MTVEIERAAFPGTHSSWAREQAIARRRWPTFVQRPHFCQFVNALIWKMRLFSMGHKSQWIETHLVEKYPAVLVSSRTCIQPIERKGHWIIRLCMSRWLLQLKRYWMVGTNQRATISLRKKVKFRNEVKDLYFLTFKRKKNYTQNVEWIFKMRLSSSGFSDLRRNIRFNSGWDTMLEKNINTLICIEMTIRVESIINSHIMAFIARIFNYVWTV